MLSGKQGEGKKAASAAGVSRPVEGTGPVGGGWFPLHQRTDWVPADRVCEKAGGEKGHAPGWRGDLKIKIAKTAFRAAARNAVFCCAGRGKLQDVVCRKWNAHYTMRPCQKEAPESEIICNKFHQNGTRGKMEVSANPLKSLDFFAEKLKKSIAICLHNRYTWNHKVE